MNNVKNRNIYIISLLIISVIILHTLLSKYIIPTDYYNMDGTHSWLSSSTIKFTNNWLEESPIKLKFLMLELPKSIESQEIDSRTPYVSYPSGTILVTYIVAKLIGVNSIDISYIKHLLNYIYMFDAVFIAVLLYFICNKINKNKNKSLGFIVSLWLTTIWILLPSNVYYLKNILFSDQLVLLYVIIYTIFEYKYEDIISINNKIIKYMLLIIYYIIGFLGVYTDWYFVILMFIAFILRIIRNIIKYKNIRQYIKKMFIKDLLQYAIPFLLAMGIFALQVASIDNGFDLLISKANQRTGIDDVNNSENFYMTILKNMSAVYTKLGLIFFAISFVALLYLIYRAIFKYNKLGKDKTDILNFIYISLLIMVPPTIQLIVLKNHSAIHEFSVLKTGLPFIFSFVIIIYVLLELFNIDKDSNLILNLSSEKKDRKKYLNIFYTLLILISIIVLDKTNIISNIYIYNNQRLMASNSYELENYIKNNSEFSDIYFSFDYEIPENPPNSLAVSKKRVYKIQDIQDIYKQFPNLDENANVNIIVDTTNKDSISKINSSFKKQSTIGKYEIYIYN